MRLRSPTSGIVQDKFSGLQDSPQRSIPFGPRSSRRAARRCPWAVDCCPAGRTRQNPEIRARSFGQVQGITPEGHRVELGRHLPGSVWLRAQCSRRTLSPCWSRTGRRSLGPTGPRPRPGWAIRQCAYRVSAHRNFERRGAVVERHLPSSYRCPWCLRWTAKTCHMPPREGPMREGLCPTGSARQTGTLRHGRSRLQD
jgi:hypothetical protein